MSERQSVSSSYVSPCSMLELRRLARLWSPSQDETEILSSLRRLSKSCCSHLLQIVRVHELD